MALGELAGWAPFPRWPCWLEPQPPHCSQTAAVRCDIEAGVDLLGGHHAGQLWCAALLVSIRTVSWSRSPSAGLQCCCAGMAPAPLGPMSVRCQSWCFAAYSCLPWALRRSQQGSVSTRESQSAIALVSDQGTASHLAGATQQTCCSTLQLWTSVQLSGFAKSEPTRV